MKETKKQKKKKKPSNNNNDSKQKNQERTTDEVFKVNEWVILITQFGEEWRCEACKELKTKKTILLTESDTFTFDLSPAVIADNEISCLSALLCVWLKLFWDQISSLIWR